MARKGGRTSSTIRKDIQVIKNVDIIREVTKGKRKDDRSLSFLSLFFFLFFKERWGAGAAERDGLENHCG